MQYHEFIVSGKWLLLIMNFYSILSCHEKIQMLTVSKQKRSKSNAKLFISWRLQIQFYLYHIMESNNNNMLDKLSSLFQAISFFKNKGQDEEPEISKLQKLKLYFSIARSPHLLLLKQYAKSFKNEALSSENFDYRRVIFLVSFLASLTVFTLVPLITQNPEYAIIKNSTQRESQQQNIGRNFAFTCVAYLLLSCIMNWFSNNLKQEEKMYERWPIEQGFLYLLIFNGFFLANECSSQYHLSISTVFLSSLYLYTISKYLSPKIISYVRLFSLACIYMTIVFHVIDEETKFVHGFQNSISGLQQIEEDDQKINLPGLGSPSNAINQSLCQQNTNKTSCEQNLMGNGHINQENIEQAFVVGNYSEIQGNAQEILQRKGIQVSQELASDKIPTSEEEKTKESAKNKPQKTPKIDTPKPQPQTTSSPQIPNTKKASNSHKNQKNKFSHSQKNSNYRKNSKRGYRNQA